LTTVPVLGHIVATMADYFGLDEIAARMKVSKFTILKWWRQRKFLMYKRHRHFKTKWYTNDSLILQWEVARCLSDRNFRGQEREKKSDDAVLRAS
jgi:hypothetical protein